MKWKGDTDISERFAFWSECGTICTAHVFFVTKWLRRWKKWAYKDREQYQNSWWNLQKCHRNSREFYVIHELSISQIIVKVPPCEIFQSRSITFFLLSLWRNCLETSYCQWKKTKYSFLFVSLPIRMIKTLKMSKSVDINSSMVILENTLC